MTANPTDVGPITDWIAGTDGAVLAGNHAGWDLDIVKPGATGLEIFPVR